MSTVKKSLLSTPLNTIHKTLTLDSFAAFLKEWVEVSLNDHVTRMETHLLWQLNVKSLFYIEAYYYLL